MPSRFASFPKFASGEKVVLDEDTRLGGAFTGVSAGTKAMLPADRQHVVFTRLAVDGTLVLDGTLILI